MTIGQHIRERRVAAGLSLDQVARKLTCMTSGHLGKLERGTVQWRPAYRDELLRAIPGLDAEKLEVAK